MNAKALTKNILDLLPANGKKTSIGAFLGIIALLRNAFPGVDIMELLKVLLTTHLDKTAIATLVIGLLHKHVKTPAVPVKSK